MLLRVMSLVMMAAGAGTALLGAGSIVGADGASAVVDSELRFYAIWYAVAGVVLWRALPTIEKDKWLIRTISIAFFAAGCARALSWFVVGRPHGFQIVLMSVEIALPLVIVSWHAAVTSRDTPPTA